MRTQPFTSADYLEGGGYDADRSGERVTDLRRRVAQAVDQRTPAPMSSNSHGKNPPIELDDMCPRAILVLFRRPDGRHITRRMPCGAKSCEWCGPRQRAKLAALWAHAMAGDRVNLWEGTDQEWTKQRRRKEMQGHQVGHIPAPDGRRTVVTTASIGKPVADKIGTLARAFAAMPNDGRRWFLSDDWRDVVRDVEAEEAAKREPWQYEGVVGRSPEHVEMAARELGVFVSRAGDQVLIEAFPDRATKQRFFALIRLRRARDPDQEGEAAA